jgi:hypothetical protein
VEIKERNAVEAEFALRPSERPSITEIARVAVRYLETKELGP